MEMEIGFVGCFTRQDAVARCTANSVILDQIPFQIVSPSAVLNSLLSGMGAKKHVQIAEDAIVQRHALPR